MQSFKKNSFVLYKSYRRSVEALTREDRGDLLAAIFEYQTDGKITTGLSPLCSMAFTFIKAQFEIDENKYLDIVERNRANGKKGGRPKSSTKKAKTQWEMGFKNVDNTRDFATFEHEQKDEQKNPKADNDNEDDVDNDITPPLSPSKEGENNNNNSMCYTAREDLEFEIIKFFRKHQFISNVEDFISYNNARGWKGYGGEDIRADWERYAWKWETEEHRKQGDTEWRPPWDL